MAAREYLSRGVSPSKEDVHRAIAELPMGLFPGAFCRVIPDLADPAYATVLHADGAGTKSTIAYIAYRERGDAAAFAGIAQDSAVMNLDDMICVGACEGFWRACSTSATKLLPDANIAKSFAKSSGDW